MFIFIFNAFFEVNFPCFNFIQWSPTTNTSLFSIHNNISKIQEVKL